MLGPLTDVLAHSPVHDSDLEHTSTALTHEIHCAYLTKLVVTPTDMPPLRLCLKSQMGQCI